MVFTESFITISFQHHVVFLSGIRIITLFYTLLISNLALILCSTEFSAHQTTLTCDFAIFLVFI